MTHLHQDADFLFRTHPRAMWIYDDASYRFLDVNDAAIERYGYTREEFLQMTLLDIRPLADVQRLVSLERPSTVRQFEHGAVWRHLHKDGRLMHVRISGQRVTFAGQPATLIAVEDVSDYVEAVEALTRERLHTEQAVAVAQMGMWSVGLQPPHRVEWSPYMYTLFGREPATFEPLPAMFDDLVAPDDLEALNQATDDAIDAGGGAFECDVRIARGDGELRWLRVRADVQLSSEGVPWRIIGVCIDITDDRAQAEMAARLAREAELRRLRDQFLSAVAHEFRNPLAAISTSADMLYHHYTRMSTSQRDERISNIRVQIDHLLSLVDDVALLLRGETTGLTYHPGPIDIARLCGTLFDEMRANHPARDVRYEADAESCIVYADKKLLRSAITNLLDNAVKYSPDAARVRLGLFTLGDRVTIEVTDEGIGIPEDEQIRLFQPFFRARNVGEKPGTGLGLAIARQAVQAHGGDIFVRSALGRGTVFTVMLPRTS
jgi:PAS domain S-box-containing protein